MVGESFPWWLRITHWFNFFFLILLFRSGYEILMSHPKLYWNDDGEPGSEWLRVGDEERSTDFDKEVIEGEDLWAAEDEIDPPSALVSLPGRDAIGMGRHWHFWGALGWTVCGALYVGALFVSGEWLRLVPTSPAVFAQAWSDLLTYLQLEIPHAEGYNALQQLAYFGVVFVLSPLMIVTGVLQAPAFRAHFPDRFSENRQLNRSLHFVGFVAFNVFLVTHVALVAAHGFWAEMQKIVIGPGAPDGALAGAWAAIAGTCVLGSQFVVFEVSTAIATGLLAVGAVLWFVLIYAVFAALTIRDADEPIDRGIDGSWFLAVVATQSVAALAGLLAPVHSSIREPLLLAALGLYSIGGTFYLLLITLVFYRLTFFPFDPRSASPPYWINTGAVAITTLAGAILLENAGRWPFLADVWGFLAGFTFFFWATGTWWIPLLLVLGVWRHTVGGMALPHTVAGYDPRYWGMVFPLGMYTASTFRFATATDVVVLERVPELFIYVALLAWTVVGIGLVRRTLERASPFAD